jgi:hypothetical protein
MEHDVCTSSSVTHQSHLPLKLDQLRLLQANHLLLLRLLVSP